MAKKTKSKKKQAKQQVKAVHKWLTWFWVANFPVATLLYFYTGQKLMGFYIALCSVYANVEASAAAKEGAEGNE